MQEEYKISLFAIVAENQIQSYNTRPPKGTKPTHSQSDIHCIFVYVFERYNSSDEVDPASRYYRSSLSPKRRYLLTYVQVQ